MNKNLKILILVLVIVIVGVVLFLCFKYMNSNVNSEEESSNEMVKPVDIDPNDSFRISFIKQSNINENFLISPYSVEIALNMLKEGTNGQTKNEIETLIQSRKLSLKNEKVKVANAIFMKNDYKQIIEKSYINKLSTNYNAELLYDDFKEPDVINNWVKQKTDGMIEKILDSIDQGFVLGLANAIAIDAKWQIPFECERTLKQEFTKLNGEKTEVEMMNNNYLNTAKYLDDSDIKGVILPYNEELEFIALLPNENLYDYINNLNEKKLDDIINSFKEATKDKRLSLSLPRFKYTFDLENFKDILISMGIKSVFSEQAADLTSIITKENMNKNSIENIYVDKAIHKTYIDLNEKGTKAAAVTYFGIARNTAIEDYEIVRIKFNKPFLYIIRDKESKEMLFFGTVYEPNTWNGSTCSNE